MMQTRTGYAGRAEDQHDIGDDVTCDSGNDRHQVARPVIGFLTRTMLSQAREILSNMSTIFEPGEDIRNDEAHIAGLVDELAALASNLFDLAKGPGPVRTGCGRCPTGLPGPVVAVG